MRQLLILLLCLWAVVGRAKAAEVLIVADEVPAMEALAQAMKEAEGIESQIVTQDLMPATLVGFRAVIVYIHQELYPGPEKAFIDYARDGGKLILLHHSVSSHKRKNEHWFPFLGLDLPKGDVSQGGYGYAGDIDMAVVNLAPRHFITTHKVAYDTVLTYTDERGMDRERPGFVLRDTEGFLNHNLQGPRTVLLGYRFRDKDGKIWTQDRAAWCRKVGKGWLFYSQPGHAVSDFQNPVYSRIVTNAVLFKP